MAQPPAARQQLGLLGLRRGRLLDLPQLELEEVELAVPGAGALAQLVQGRLEGPRAGVRGGARGAPRGLPGAGEPVQEIQLRGRQRQPPVLVLAVEAQEPLRGLAQVAHRRRAAVEIGPRAPLGGHPPRQDELLGVGRHTVAQRIAQAVREVEDALDVRLGSTRAHHPGLGPSAEQEVQGVCEHRLAGPGLARQDVESGRQAQLGPLDEEEVLDAQLVQHGCDATRPRGRNGSNARSHPAEDGPEAAGRRRCAPAGIWPSCGTSVERATRSRRTSPRTLGSTNPGVRPYCSRWLPGCAHRPAARNGAATAPHGR